MWEDADKHLAFPAHSSGNCPPGRFNLTGAYSGRGSSLETKFSEAHTVTLSRCMSTMLYSKCLPKLCLLRLQHHGLPPQNLVTQGPDQGYYRY